MKFTELDLPQTVLKGIEAVGFTELTPVQEETIPLALAGKDVAGQAQTGTGKTAAFLISLFTRLSKSSQKTGSDPRALIIAPTRELVVQIWEDAKGLGSFCPFKVQPIFGGVDYDKQRQSLKDGVDIIVATPGRLIDYAKQGVFGFQRIEALVIDEADRMFDMGFIRDLRYILRKLPPFEKRQTMLFSATLSSRVMELAYEFMNLAEKVNIAPDKVTAERVDQVLYHVARQEKFALLLGLMQRITDPCRMLLFVNTKREAEHLTERLKINGYKAAVLSGDIPQKKRMRILEDFKANRLHYLVGTDVASRGIHVDGVTHVINYDLPQDPEDYVHRIGRTARAGASGQAISFADEDLVFYLSDIEAYIGSSIPTVFPEEDLFCHAYKRYVPRRKPAGDDRRRSPEKSRKPPRRRPGRKTGDSGSGGSSKS